MCGIAGLVSLQENNLQRTQLKKMLKSMIHRGPDSCGEAVFSDGMMGMRRLSIVDVSGGSQPFFNSDSSIIVIGNGEIYNYPEIVDDVKKRHRLKSKSDIEIIMHLYEDFGVNCLKKIKGMFAFALYDKKKNILLLARDRLGEKPLYYTVVDDTFFFASELKSILTIAGVEKVLELESVANYFGYYSASGQKTFIQNVQKLPAAHYLILNLQNLQLTIGQYWQASQKFKSLSNPKQQLRTAIKKAFFRSMMADVPVGIALSGGLDSAAILSVLAPQHRVQLTAFTIGYEGCPPTDERSHAKRLCRDFGVNFVEQELLDKDVVSNFPRVVINGDEPIADIAIQGVSSVSHLAREHHCKVLLSGSGGDELFWGYQWLEKSLRKNLQKLKKIKKGSRLWFADDHPSFLGEKRFLRNLYDWKFKKFTRENELPSQIYLDKKPTRLNLARFFLEQIRTQWLQPDLLVINDRVGMSNSVEMRCPFLDCDLVNMVYSHKQTLLGFEYGHKYWLKAALRNEIPSYVLEKKKQGFTPPVARWLYKIIGRYSYLLEDGFLVNQEILSRNRAMLVKNSWFLYPFFWYQIYQLLVLEIWGRHYLQNENFENF